MNRPVALVVDDEPDIRELIELTLARMEIDTVPVGDLAAARAAAGAGPLDLCLTDMRLPDGDGIDLVRHMSQHHPAVPVAVITAHGNVSSAVEALKAGAFDFVSKPVNLQVLRNLVQTALRLRQRSASSQRRLIGDSPGMQEVRATIAKLARSQAPVFVSGESGTGKELVARMIHEGGPRAEAPFVPVNCGAIPQELMESELFGHRRGAFTGATADKAGLFQAADGGTLFLDEVADLPLHMQVKLLRAIQEKAVRPVGEERERSVDVRILSASHRDLEALVKAGRFRHDLYYRLNVITLRVPPLRDRREDIPALAAHVLDRLAIQWGGEPGRLSPEARERLLAHDFPGNVRELENVLERAVTLCETDEIGVEDLGLPERSGEAPLRGSAEPGTQQAGGVGGGTGVAEDLPDALVHVERERIRVALDRTGGNKTAAARLLGISMWSLRYRMQKLGLD